MAYYRKRDNGWEYRISYKAPDGSYKQKSKSGFRTKSEATQAAAQAEIELQKGITIDNKITFAEYFIQWAKIYKEPSVSAGTWKNYQQVHKTVVEYFGEKKIKDIRPSTYQQILNKMGKRYYKVTLYKYHHKMRSAVKHAVADGLISNNFTDLAIIVSDKDGKDEANKFLSENEYKKLLDDLKIDIKKYRYMQIYLVAVTGMRIGESLGLTWQDIDFENGWLSINKTWNIYTNNDFAPTKNKQSIRKIPIDKTTAKLLKDYQQDWQSNKWNRLFLTPHHADINRLLKKLVGRPVHIHSLRHTYASYLLSHRIDVQTVSHLLGHKNVLITLNTYAHLLQEQKDQDMQKVKTLLGRI